MSQPQFNQPTSILATKHQPPTSQNNMSPLSHMSPLSQASKRKLQSKNFNKTHCRICPRCPMSLTNQAYIPIKSNQHLNLSQMSPLSHVSNQPDKETSNDPSTTRPTKMSQCPRCPKQPSIHLQQKAAPAKNDQQKIITNVPMSPPNLSTTIVTLALSF